MKIAYSPPFSGLVHFYAEIKSKMRVQLLFQTKADLDRLVDALHLFLR